MYVELMAMDEKIQIHLNSSTLPKQEDLMSWKNQIDLADNCIHDLRNNLNDTDLDDIRNLRGIVVSTKMKIDIISKLESKGIFSVNCFM